MTSSRRRQVASVLLHRVLEAFDVKAAAAQLRDELMAIETSGEQG